MLYAGEKEEGSFLIANNLGKTNFCKSPIAAELRKTDISAAGIKVVFVVRSINGSMICCDENDILVPFSALISLPYLAELHLESCTLCDQIDTVVQMQFIETIISRRVVHSGVVRSMRFDPDSNH